MTADRVGTMLTEAREELRAVDQRKAALQQIVTGLEALLRVGEPVYVEKAQISPALAEPAAHAQSEPIAATEQPAQAIPSIKPSNKSTAPARRTRVHKTSSKYRGVNLEGPAGRKRPWRVQLNIKGENVYGGVYATEEEAARAYDAKVRELHLDKPLNFPAEGLREEYDRVTKAWVNSITSGWEDEPEPEPEPAARACVTCGNPLDRNRPLAMYCQACATAANTAKRTQAIPREALVVGPEASYEAWERSQAVEGQAKPYADFSRWFSREAKPTRAGWLEYLEEGARFAGTTLFSERRTAA